MDGARMWIAVGAGVVQGVMMMFLAHWLEISWGKAAACLIVGYGIAFVTREIQDEVSRDAAPARR